MLTTRAPIPSAFEPFVGLHAERDFAARGEQQHVGLAVAGIREHVRATLHALGGGVLRAVERRHRLPRQDQRHRLVAELHDHAPGFDHFVGIGRPQRDQAGNGAQGHQLLDRLMGRPILADADRIVREDVDDRNFHQRAQADRRAAVVAENQEPRSEWADLRQRQTVEDGAHGVLTDTKMEIPPGGSLRAEITGALERQARLA